MLYTDPTPENEASQSLLASAKAKMEDTFSVVGRRIVSEKEWQGLQEEVWTHSLGYLLVHTFYMWNLTHCMTSTHFGVKCGRGRNYLEGFNRISHQSILGRKWQYVM